ncbi:MAG: NADH/ubiquinone/plastoquinone (complex I) [Candidatus Omnitrophica bacterium]|nr:NADH/ubiquinone/plastoquinone (complex I) [Candidatus Omnitrophota bacterium]
MLPIFIIIPLGCAFLIPLVAKFRQALAQVLAVVCGLALVYFSAQSIGWLRSGVQIYAAGGWKPPFGICMVLDGFTVMMLLVVNTIGCLALIYSIDYIKRYTQPYFYYTLFCLLLAGLNGVVISGDLFNLFVFLEITSIASYALVAFGTEAEELEAAFKYLVLGSIASSMILLGIGVLLGHVSTLNMADISRALSVSEARNLLLFCLALFIMGFGLKIALVPFHAWLPDAHPAAPAPISAMLSGVVIKTIGVYALCRVLFNIIGITPVVSSILVWLGIISMAIGVLLAIGQWDFKRLLAYHSVSQIGYIIFGIGLGTPLGIAGGLFHLFNHSLFKSLLFLNSGAVEYATGTRKLDQLGGISSAMPVTSVTSLIASFSIAGVPPLCGFWSKLLIIIAAFQANHFIGAIVCIITAIVTLASFLKVQKYVFLRLVNVACPSIQEVPLSMRLAMIVLAIACVGVGLLYAPFLKIIIEPAANVLLLGVGYARIILGT